MTFMPGKDHTSEAAELEALFDAVAAQAGFSVLQTPVQPAVPATPPLPMPAESQAASQVRVFNSIGQMMRQLTDTLHGLGYDRLIEEAVAAMPDARDRLSYVANLTEQAACRVLNATDIAQPLQETLANGARVLGDRWEQLYANQLSVEEFKTLAADTRSFLRDEAPRHAVATNAQLLEIMMAQDFQDLTGQVIKKLVSLAQNLETQLMQVLVEVVPENYRTDSVNSLLNGPVVNPQGVAGAVAGQQQVDDLLDSLGF